MNPSHASHASHAFMLKPEQDWDCFNCGFQNKMKDDRCAACNTSYEKSELLEASSVPLPLDGDEPEFMPEQSADRRISELEIALMVSNREAEQLAFDLRELNRHAEQLAAELHELKQHACSICQYPYNKTNRRPYTSTCGHTYCGMCWNTAFLTHPNRCPACRSNIAKPTVPTFELEEILHLKGVKKRSQSKKNRKSNKLR